MAARSSRRRQRRRVRSEAALRFGPEEFTLSELVRAAAQDRDFAIGAARSSAEGVRLAARAAEPEVRGAYGEAAQAAGMSAQTLAEQLARIGGAAEPFQAAIAREQEGGRARHASSLARAVAELKERQVEAKSGEAFATQNAISRYASEVGQLGRRAQALSRERGAFTQGRLSELIDEETARQDTLREQRADRGQDERESLRSAGIDPDTGEPIPGGELDPDADGRRGGSRETASERRTRRSTQAKFEDQVGQAFGTVQRLRRQLGNAVDDPRKTIGEILLTGTYQARVVKRDSKGRTLKDENGRTVYETKTFTVPRAEQLAASIALDLAFRGFVSNYNRNRVRRRQLSTAPEWRPTKEKVERFRRRRARSAGAAGAATGAATGARR